MTAKNTMIPWRPAERQVTVRNPIFSDSTIIQHEVLILSELNVITFLPERFQVYK